MSKCHVVTVYQSSVTGGSVNAVLVIPALKTAKLQCCSFCARLDVLTAEVDVLSVVLDKVVCCQAS